MHNQTSPSHVYHPALGGSDNKAALYIAAFIPSSPQHVTKAHPTELTGVTKMALIFTCLVALEVTPTKDYVPAVHPLANYINILALRPHGHIYDYMYLQTVPHIINDYHCAFQHIAVTWFQLDERLTDCNLLARDGYTDCSDA
jgi:hypothetical protein